MTSTWIATPAEVATNFFGKCAETLLPIDRMRPQTSAESGARVAPPRRPLGRKQGAVEIAHVIVALHLGAEVELVGEPVKLLMIADLAEMRQVVIGEEMEIALRRQAGNASMR